MAKRYIDAEALLEELQEELDFESPLYTKEQSEWFDKGLKCAVRDVKHQPTAEVAPKSEVAKEIFKAIEEVLRVHSEGGYYLNGVWFPERLDLDTKDAIEKRIPKKVHFHHSREKGICPNCLSVEDTSANYCRCCGQLLDFDTDHPTEKGGEE